MKQGDRICLPSSLKEKRSLFDLKYKKKVREIVSSMEKERSDKVKLLAEIVKSLIYFYENKNRSSSNSCA